MDNSSLREATEIIFGTKTGGYYLAGFVFSFAGILISLYYSSTKRDKASTNTPDKFSWSFLFWDNTKRVVVTLLTMFILFRVFDLSNILAMIGVGVVVTLFFDQVLEFIMSSSEIIKGLMKMNREKFMQKQVEGNK